MPPKGLSSTIPEFAYFVTDRDIDFAKITSITFRIRSSDNNFIDELRIGRTYADVIIPEPRTLVLLAWLALGASALGRRY